MSTGHIGHCAAALVVALTAATAAPAVGQELGEQAKRQVRGIYADKAGWTAAQKKLDTSLIYASRNSRGEPMVQGMAAEPDLALLRRVTSRAGVEPDGMVVVDIRAEVTDALLAAIGSAGGKVVSAFPASHAVRARIPIGQVEAIAALEEVRQISARQQFVLNVGAATSQGDTAHRAQAARTASGLDGTGIKVGVLSDGVDSLAARQATSDLPATCAAPPGAGSCVTVVPGQAGSGDEGTAMMEIVHDLAPGAQIYFATATGGAAGFANNILTLRNTYGCDVIVDDVTYLAEGAFQDGPIAQAVTAVKNAGALFFSSAGNSGRKDANTSGTWEGDWHDSGCPVTETGLGFPYDNIPSHSFTGAAGCGAAHAEYLRAAYSSGHVVTLKWSDPLGASSNDYDLLLYNGATLVDASMGAQDGTQDPIEGLVAYLGDTLVVTQYSGVARALRIDTNRAYVSIGTEGATYGHNGGESTITVAAASVSSAGGGAFVGGGTNPVESYSSDGPRRMFYYSSGTAITPGNVLFGTSGGRVLQKPDVTAADCVATTTPGFSPFCGTSAAAPHAAAIAALLLSSAPGLQGGQALAAMYGTALDVTPGVGRDRNAGVGIVMADTALQALPTNAQFYTVDPCRVVDTRTSGGAIACGTERTVTVAGACGVPSGAKAVSLNVTVTTPTAAGNVRVYGAGAPTPTVSSLNYSAGQTRGNNAIAPLSTDGKMSIFCSPSGTAQVIVDVNGYFK